MPGPFLLQAGDLLAGATGRNLKIVAVTQPPMGGGSVFFSYADQTVTYSVPPQNADGTYPPTDSFTYTIQNAQGTRSSATVSINLTNCPGMGEQPGGNNPPPATLPVANDDVFSVVFESTTFWMRPTYEGLKLASNTSLTETIGYAVGDVINTLGVEIGVTDTMTVAEFIGRFNTLAAGKYLRMAQVDENQGPADPGFLCLFRANKAFSDTEEGTLDYSLFGASIARGHMPYQHPATALPALLNDTGIGLSITSITPPQRGTAVLTGGQILYTPPDPADAYLIDGGGGINGSGNNATYFANAGVQVGDLAIGVVMSQGSPGTLVSGWTVLDHKTADWADVTLCYRVADQSYVAQNQAAAANASQIALTTGSTNTTASYVYFTRPAPGVSPSEAMRGGSVAILSPSLATQPLYRYRGSKTFNPQQTTYADLGYATDRENVVILGSAVDNVGMVSNPAFAIKPTTIFMNVESDQGLAARDIRLKMVDGQGNVVTGRAIGGYTALGSPELWCTSPLSDVEIAGLDARFFGTVTAQPVIQQPTGVSYDSAAGQDKPDRDIIVTLFSCAVGYGTSFARQRNADLGLDGDFFITCADGMTGQPPIFANSGGFGQYARAGQNYPSCRLYDAERLVAVQFAVNAAPLPVDSMSYGITDQNGVTATAAIRINLVTNTSTSL